MVFADDVKLGAIVSYVGVGHSEGVQRGRRGFGTNGRVHPAGAGGYDAKVDLSTQLMRYGTYVTVHTTRVCTRS